MNFRRQNVQWINAVKPFVSRRIHRDTSIDYETIGSLLLKLGMGRKEHYIADWVAVLFFIAGIFSLDRFCRFTLLRHIIRMSWSTDARTPTAGVPFVSGSGTNLKVGGTGAAQKWGAPIWREAPKKFFLVVPLHFLALKAQLVVLVSAFVMVNVILTVPPPCPAICKSGGTCPPCPKESAPLPFVPYQFEKQCF